MAQEKGFIGMSTGSAEYEGVLPQKAVQSFFLVRPWDGVDFGLGATVYSSYVSNSNESSTTGDDGYSEEAVSSFNVQHIAYGTLFGYTWSSEGFVGFQAWAGTGYMTNVMEVETSRISVKKTDANGTSFCQGSSSGQSSSVYSFPVFYGVGMTVNNFGFFVQSFRQSLSPITLSTDFTLSCKSFSDGQNTETTQSNSSETDLISTFSMVSTGIHYRF